MMLSAASKSSSLLLSSSSSRVVAFRRSCAVPVRRTAATTSTFQNASTSRTNHPSVLAAAAVAVAAAVATTTTLAVNNNKDSYKTLNAAKPPIGGELIQTAPPVKEPKTGILFPVLCNGYLLAGTGVRVKWGLIQVYAVGTYLDPLAMSAVKKSADVGVMEEALLDPTYPRTIRIVMARGLSMKKFTDSIAEALEPRMKGQDLEKLEEFKALNPPMDLIAGAEIEMTIRGDTLLYKNATGGVGTIRSEAFTRALCDTYFGADPVSPSHKSAVLEGIPKL